MNNITASATYRDRVELEYTFEEQTVRAHQIRKGDRVNGREIAKVKVGSKRFTAWDANDKELIYSHLEDGMHIERPVPTEASLEANRVNRVNLRLANRIEAAQETLDETKRAVMDATIASHWDIEKMVAAQERLRVYAQLATVAENTGDLYKAAEHLAKEFQSAILRAATSATSRSTSAFSNVCEDVSLSVKAEFIDSLHGMF